MEDTFEVTQEPSGKTVASNIVLVQQAFFLIGITFFATAILVCADMARSFRRAELSSPSSGQAMYAAAANLLVLEKQERALKEERRRVTERYVQAIAYLDQVSQLDLAARVQFRRILSQCYYPYYAKQVDLIETAAPGAKLEALDQRFLSKVYGAINLDAFAKPNCQASNPTSNQSTALEMLGLAELAAIASQGTKEPPPFFKDYCNSEHFGKLRPEQAKECSYSNVVAYVSLREGAVTRLQELTKAQQALSDQLAALKVQRDADPALRDPASLETTRLLLSFMKAEDGSALSPRQGRSIPDEPTAQTVFVTNIVRPVEDFFNYCFQVLLTAPALALTILLSLATGAVGGAYRSAWVAYSALEDDVAFLSVKDSLQLGAFLGAAVGLLTWLGLMTTGAVVGGQEGPAANIDPKLLAAIAVAAGLANREAMLFLVTTAQQKNGQPDPIAVPEPQPPLAPNQHLA